MTHMQTTQSIGFSNGDTLMLFLLHEAKNTAITPTQIHELFHVRFPGKTIGYDYIARLAKKHAELGHLTVHTDEGNDKFYQTTSLGLELLQRYHMLYYGQLHEIFLVIERFYYELTKNGVKPSYPEHSLPAEFRTYFSKLVSVKDIVRYMILKIGHAREEFYIAEVNDLLKIQFGWHPSNTYLYSIAREMEANGTLTGYWKEPEKRTIRLVRITEDGEIFAKQITETLRQQITDVYHHLTHLLSFIRN